MRLWDNWGFPKLLKLALLHFVLPKLEAALEIDSSDIGFNSVSS